MADGLSAAQREAFQSPVLNMADFRREATLINSGAGGTEYNVDQYIKKYGQTRFQLSGWHPPTERRREKWWPHMMWTLNNNDGTFYLDGSNGLPGWFATTYLNWSARFRLYERLSTGSEVLMVELVFSVVEVNYEGDNAMITSWHPAGRFLQARWDKDVHRDEVDFDGNRQNVRL